VEKNTIENKNTKTWKNKNLTPIMVSDKYADANY
jgi:post-segregation antitoxin (ccd killing protein)